MRSVALFAVSAAIVCAQQATVPTVPGLPSYAALRYPPLKAVHIPEPRTFTLTNGIKVYLLENHELPLVGGSAVIRTGNLFDPADRRGLADITGMVLRSGGTKKQTGDELDQTLENMAARVESSIGESRGTLTFSCLKENTARVLEIFRDFLTEPEFRQNKVDLAKTQYHSGISRRNDDPGGVASREFMATVYGRTSPYGWVVEHEHINRITRPDMVDFYRRYYFPANTVLTVYGDFDAAEMQRRIEQTFGAWRNPQAAVPPFPEFNTPPAPGIYFANRDDVNQTFFEIGHIGGLYSDKDFAALQVAGNILGSGFSSRLMRRVRTELGYAYNISAGWGAGYRSPGLFEISGSTKSKSTVETIETIKQELAKMRTAEVTGEELKTAKDAVENSFVFNFDSPAKTLGRLETYEYYAYPRDFIFQYQKAVAKVTRADVLRVAREYFRPENLVIVAVGNEKELGKPMSALGKVQTLDLSIPEGAAAK